MVGKLAKPFLIDIVSFVKTRLSQILSNTPDWQYVVGKLANPFLIDIVSFVKTRLSQILSNKPDWQYVVGKVCHKVAVGAMSGCHKEKWNGMSSTVVA